MCRNGDVAKNSYLVGLKAEMFGYPCMDPNSHPVPANPETKKNTILNLLNQDHVGCGTITGPDTKASFFIAKQTFPKFFADNSKKLTQNALGKFYAFYTGSTTEEIHLYGRNRIVLKCAEECRSLDSFKFGEKSDTLLK